MQADHRAKTARTGGLDCARSKLARWRPAGKRTSDAEQVAYLLLGAARWHQTQPTRNVRTTAVTCDDTRTIKFTLIVQRLPMSEPLDLASFGHSVATV
jgi:hypothetical protein